MAIVDVEACGKELIRGRHAAVVTSVGGVGIGEIPSGGRNKLIEVLPTVQTRRWGEFDELDGGALDRLMAKSCKAN